MRDRFNKIMGRTRFVVCRLFLHLGGQDLAPLLRFLNRTAREAIDADGDLEVLGEGLVQLCQTLLQYDLLCYGDRWFLPTSNCFTNHR